MNKIRRLACGLAAAGMVIFTASCVSDGGTEIPNELVGRELIVDKGPAAEAELSLVPVGFVPGGTQDPYNSIAPLFTARADSKGRFAFSGVPDGEYNLIASQDGLRSFRDTVVVTGAKQDLRDDTLRAPATLTGRVQLAPQDDPRKAIVHLLGTLQFVNVPESGWFTLRDLGAGPYRLRVSVPNNPLYTDAFVSFSVAAGRNDTLSAPIIPYFDGIPGVEGLTATPRSDGTVLLTWNKPASKRVTGFLIYRDLAGATLPTNVPKARVSRTDTSFIDTVYQRGTRDIFAQRDTNSTYDYFDTVPHTVGYHVNILDNSLAVGPTLEIVEAAAIPPAAVKSGKWTRVSTGFWAQNRTSIVLPFRDSLFAVLLSDSSGGYFQDTALYFDKAPRILASADGIAWSPLHSDDSLNVAVLSATVWRDSIWILAKRMIAPIDTLRDDSLHPVLSLFKSRDGSSWERVADSLPIEDRTEFGFFPLHDDLWVISGQTLSETRTLLPSWKSADGRHWTRMPVDRDPMATAPGVAAFGDRAYVIGGGRIFQSVNQSIFSSTDGGTWDSAGVPQGMLPRFYNSVTSHDGKLWVIGGYQSANPLYGFLSDVWESYDGVHWLLVDGAAPFPGRGSHSAFSFQGKLWVAGGRGQNGPLGDVWMMSE